MSQKDTNKRIERICWIEQLDVVSLLSFLSLHAKSKFSHVKYTRVSRRALKLFQLFCKKDCDVSAVEFAHREVTVFDKLQVIREYDKNNNTTSSLNSYDLAKEGILKNIVGHGATQKMSQFLDQELAMELKGPLSLIQQIQLDKNSDREVNSVINHVLVKNTPWVSSLNGYIKSNNLSIVLNPFFNIRGALALVYQPIKLLCELLANGLLMLVGQSVHKREIPKNRKIAVLFAQGANLEKRCDFYWYSRSLFSPDDIIVYFKTHLHPPTEKVIKLLKGYALPWLKLMPRRLKLSPTQQTAFEINIFPCSEYSKGIKRTMKLAWALLFAHGKEGYFGFYWFWPKLLHLMDDVHFFRAFFEVYNVKLHYGAYEYGRHMMAANIAIDMEDGVDLCHHWSNYDFVDIPLSKPHDVYFTWGPYFKNNFFDQPFYHVKNYVSSGYIHDFTFSLYKELAQKHKERLLEKGAKFIISFFDQELWDIESIWNKEHIRMYQFLLELLIENKDLGLIIKPKKISSNEHFKTCYPGLKDLFLKALETKRLILLDKFSVPCEAAMASDLAIGMGVSSSPSLEAALLGIKSVTYDAEGVGHHPMYEKGINNVIFSDIEAMKQSVRKCLDQTDDCHVGDYSFVIDDVDPFRDGRSRERVGEYVCSLLDSINKGKHKKEAIDLTNEEYRGRYGFDSVMPRINEDQLVNH